MFSGFAQYQKMHAYVSCVYLLNSVRIVLSFLLHCPVISTSLFLSNSHLLFLIKCFRFYLNFLSLNQVWKWTVNWNGTGLALLYIRLLSSLFNTNAQYFMGYCFKCFIWLICYLKNKGKFSSFPPSILSYTQALWILWHC